MATCLQEAWSTVSSVVRAELEIPASEVVWCGVALGYADQSKPVNALRSDRETIDKVATFRGFTDSRDSEFDTNPSASSETMIISDSFHSRNLSRKQRCCTEGYMQSRSHMITSFAHAYDAMYILD